MPISPTPLAFFFLLLPLAAAAPNHATLAAMSSSSAAAPPVVRSGVWDGSEVDDDHIEFLRKTRRLPGEDLVRARAAPEREVSPAPEEGERVVFRSHLMRGLGLPASSFFRSFLEFHGLQPHHLTPNTVVLLSAFVTLCEGYLGVLPTLELWGSSSSPSWTRVCRACRLRVAPSS